MLIAEEIEDPFGVDDNDLPLDGMAQTIRANTDEILGRALSVTVWEALPWPQAA